MWATKLPKKAGGNYLVTINNTVRQAKYVEGYPKGNFYWLILPECAAHTSAVVAWQKQPEPYKGNKA